MKPRKALCNGVLAIAHWNGVSVPASVADVSIFQFMPSISGMCKGSHSMRRFGSLRFRKLVQERVRSPTPNANMPLPRGRKSSIALLSHVAEPRGVVIVGPT